MEPLYAPVTRLAAASSHVVVDWIFGGILLLIITWAGLLAWNAWVHAHALRKEVWQARGLRPGVILLSGVAEPVDSERREAEHDPLFPPFVELTITQRGEQRSSKNGRYVYWREIRRSLKERPFVLRTDSGTLVRVEPSSRVELVDRLEPPLRQGVERRRIAKITPGERVFVRGTLASSSSVAGPYRGDGSSDAALHTLRPARDRPLFISSEPVDAEESATARFHGLFAAVLLATLLFTQLCVFGAYQRLRNHGVTGTAHVDEVTTWVTHNKSSVTTHWGLVLGWSVDGLAFTSREEVNSSIAAEHSDGARGSYAPIVYDPKSPSTIQVGGANEVGITQGELVFASMLVGGVLLTWFVMAQSRKPWWRRQELHETQPGDL